MLLSIAILGTLVAILAVLALARGGAPLALAGIHEGAMLLLSVAPQLLLGFLLAGLVTVLVPSDVIGRVIGEESGLAGVLIATAAGVVTRAGLSCSSRWSLRWLAAAPASAQWRRT